MSPPPPLTVTGAAIRLYEATDTVIIAEGIETSLALSHALELPAWATVSALGMKTVRLPRTIRRVVIGADHDRSGTGQTAAKHLRYRLVKEGRAVELMVPDEVGDWLDVYRQEEPPSEQEVWR